MAGQQEVGAEVPGAGASRTSPCWALMAPGWLPDSPAAAFLSRGLWGASGRALEELVPQCKPRRGCWEQDAAVLVGSGLGLALLGWESGPAVTPLVMGSGTSPLSEV